MRNLDTSRLIRLTSAGAIAGLIIFFIFNPGMSALERKMVEEITQKLVNGDLKAAEQSIRDVNTHTSGIMTYFTAAFATAICALVMLAEELGSPIKRIVAKVALATLSGIMLGAVAGYLADALYKTLFNLWFNLPARTLAWALMGCGVGAGLGCALLSWRRALTCILGGSIGGAAGGILFEMVGMSIGNGNGSASRFVGFIVVGAAVGAAVVWVEDMAKQSWVTILSGPKEGRSYILTKPVTTVGRDELADIPLFGDTSIVKQHACLQMTGPIVTVQGAPGAPLTVNGAPASAQPLKDSDVLHVGRYALRFHQKATQQYVPGAQLRPQQYAGQAYQPQPTVYGPPQQQCVSASGRIVLTAVGGPHASQSFQFGPGLIKIGRELDCQICLSSDTMISRNHAEIGWDGQSWHIRDAGSRNGLWINGARSSQQILNLGDQIGIGQSVLRVDGT